jgi:hypothetical protein
LFVCVHILFGMKSVGATQCSDNATTQSWVEMDTEHTGIIYIYISIPRPEGLQNAFTCTQSERGHPDPHQGRAVHILISAGLENWQRSSVTARPTTREDVAHSLALRLPSVFWQFWIVLLLWQPRIPSDIAACGRVTGDRQYVHLFAAAAPAAAPPGAQIACDMPEKVLEA